MPQTCAKLRRYDKIKMLSNCRLCSSRRRCCRHAAAAAAKAPINVRARSRYRNSQQVRRLSLSVCLSVCRARAAERWVLREAAARFGRLPEDERRVCAPVRPYAPQRRLTSYLFAAPRDRCARRPTRAARSVSLAGRLSGCADNGKATFACAPICDRPTASDPISRPRGAHYTARPTGGRERAQPKRAESAAAAAGETPLPWALRAPQRAPLGACLSPD